MILSTESINYLLVFKVSCSE